MKKTVSGLALLAALISTQAIGKTVTLVCNGCNLTEKRLLAVEGGTGDYYIFDFVNRNLVHWSISNQNGQTIPLLPSETDVYRAVQNFYDANGGSLDFSVTAEVFTGEAGSLLTRQNQISTLSDTRPATAFDVVTTPAIRDQVVNGVATGSSLPDRVNRAMINVRELVSWVVSVNIWKIGIRIPVNAQIKAVFPDGSSVVVYYDFQNRSYAYLKGSARDAVGNPIPEDAISAAGGPDSTQKYLYPDTPAGLESGIRGIQHLNGLGIPVEMPRAFFGPWTMACTRVGQFTQCNIQPQ